MPFPLRNRQISHSLWLLLFTATAAWAQSPVWEVEKNDRLMFIGGTIHLLMPEDYPLPQAFETAYQQSKAVIFETDLDRLQSPEFQHYMLQQLSYGEGRNLQQVVSADTYAALVEFFSARGVPMTTIDNFKPGMVVMMMTMIELQRIGVVGVGVDAHFSRRLIEDQKTKGQLESVEKQIEFIANLGVGNEDAILAYNLADLAKLPESWRSMTQAWRGGDMAMLEELAATPLRQEFPEIYQTMVVDRNNAWIPQIEALANTQQVELVLVGALHLVGDEGLLAELARRGYRVRQLP
jgi:uncharacterized protein YbaP (TraB family)